MRQGTEGCDDILVAAASRTPHRCIFKFEQRMGEEEVEGLFVAQRQTRGTLVTIPAPSLYKSNQHNEDISDSKAG
jgi:hypothetical protein